MSWIVWEYRRPEDGQFRWIATCLEPGCFWVISGIRSDMSAASAIEHTLSAHTFAVKTPR